MTIRADAFNLDSKESAIFARQLEHVKSRSYNTKYKSLKATSLIPVSTEAPAGADTITYQSFTKIGVAKIISDYANDFPRVDVYGTEKTAQVRSIGSSFGYSIKEVRRAQMAGTNLNQRRADTARRAVEEKQEAVAWNGDSDYGLQGFIGFPGITEYTVPNDGTGTTKTWSTKTPDQIVRDVTGMVLAVSNTTNGVEIPTDLLLPLTQYMLLKNTRMTDGNDKTIMTYLLENDIINAINWITQLTTAGASSTAQMMVYVKDPMNLTLEIPQPYEQFAPQAKGMSFEVPCHAETGGVIVYYPLSVAYGDGI